MSFTFDAAVVGAVLHHMNDDHNDDSLLIARAFADDTATAAVMTGFDGDGGDWDVTTPNGVTSVRIPWPGGAITERPAVRREIVELYDLACERLDIEPRPHA